MAFQSRTLCLLLVVLGVALLWTATGIDGPETNTVHQYTAYEVTHEDELILTDVESDEERSGTTVNVDENIVCLPSFTLECTLVSKESAGEINASGIRSTFQYAYLDGEFHRISSGSRDSQSRFTFEYEQTNTTIAFDELALDADRITDAERKALKTGEVITTRPVLHTNRLVEYEGGYYTILETGSKVSSSSGSSCASSGDGFCVEADRYRYQHWLPRLGYGGLGVIGVLVGGRGLLRDYRSD